MFLIGARMLQVASGELVSVRNTLMPCTVLCGVLSSQGTRGLVPVVYGCMKICGNGQHGRCDALVGRAVCYV